MMRTRVSVAVVISLLLMLPSVVAALAAPASVPMNNTSHPAFEFTQRGQPSLVPSSRGKQEQANLCDGVCMFQYMACVLRDGTMGGCDQILADCTAGCHPEIDGIKKEEKQKTDTVVTRNIVAQGNRPHGTRH